MNTSKCLKVGVLSALLALSTASFAQPVHFDQKSASKTQCSGALAQALEAAGKTKHPNGVPELSVNSAGTAAVVIVCGLLVLAGRRRKGGDANA